MRKYKITWTKRAREQLESIARHIARKAPRAAERFLQKLKGKVDGLGFFPEVGARIEGVEDQEFREIYYGNYRIVYRFDGRNILMTGVYHGARHLSPEDLTEQ